MEDRPTEKSYLTRASGKDLGETMPMWRVQTEGYKDGKGMLVGVVTPGKVLDNAPDSEYISAGVNTKGVDSVALGRQGSFFHWGFAASPTYMTDEAKLVFVNAVHYISKFKGQQAFVKKHIYASRTSLDDMYYTMSEEGFSKWLAMLDEGRKAREKQKEELLKKQEDGEELSRFEKMMIDAPPMKEYTRFDLVRVPDELKEKFGEEWDKYEEYYQSNRGFLHSPDAKTGRGLLLDVDLDAKKLGIPNHDVRMLDRCVELLDSEGDEEKQLAHKLLKQYTEEDFETSQQWKHWLGTYRDYLYFSDVSGFKFLVDVNRLPNSLKASPKPPVVSSADIRTMVNEIKVADVGEDSPVQFEAVLKKVETSEGQRVRLIVKTKIHDGWHLYAHVPKGSPYIETKFEIAGLKGLTKTGEWTQSAAHPSFDDPGLMLWEGEAFAWHDLAISENDIEPSIELTIKFQTCDAEKCLPPKTLKREVSLEE